MTPEAKAIEALLEAISKYDDAVESEPPEVTCTPFRDTADNVCDAAQALIRILAD